MAQIKIIVVNCCYCAFLMQPSVPVLLCLLLVYYVGLIR